MEEKGKGLLSRIVKSISNWPKGLVAYGRPWDGRCPHGCIGLCGTLLLSLTCIGTFINFPPFLPNVGMLSLKWSWPIVTKDGKFLVLMLVHSGSVMYLAFQPWTEASFCNWVGGVLCAEARSDLLRLMPEYIATRLVLRQWDRGWNWSEENSASVPMIVSFQHTNNTCIPPLFFLVLCAVAGGGVLVRNPGDFGMPWGALGKAQCIGNVCRIPWGVFQWQAWWSWAWAHDKAGPVT